MDDDIIILPSAAPGGSRPRWWLATGSGVAASLIGIGMLIWPFGAASWILSVLVGLSFVVSGSGSLLSQRSGGKGFGIFLIVAGVLAVVFSAFTAKLLVSMLAILVIGFAIVLFMIALGTRTGALLFLSVVLAGIGVLALTRQDIALVIFAIGLGILTLLIGSWLLWLGNQMRRAVPPRG